MTTEVSEVQFVSNMGDLLVASENADPTKTATTLFQLPVTTQLQDRFAMVFTGPEARILTTLMTEYYVNLVEHIRQKRAAA